MHHKQAVTSLRFQKHTKKKDLKPHKDARHGKFGTITNDTFPPG